MTRTFDFCQKLKVEAKGFVLDPVTAGQRRPEGPVLRRPGHDQPEEPVVGQEREYKSLMAGTGGHCKGSGSQLPSERTCKADKAPPKLGAAARPRAACPAWSAIRSAVAA